MNRVLVLGATGYVGARLVPRLIADGHSVRCSSRSVADLRSWAWADEVETVEADLAELDLPTEQRLFADVDTVVYLVHSMTGSGDFVARDRKIASTTRDAMQRHGVRRAVYLSGLGVAVGSDDSMSDHLDSRQEVGAILREGVPEMRELRAALLLGSGSASFELLRTAGELGPIVPVPRVVHQTQCQPIAVADALDDLAWAVRDDQSASDVLEIGGATVLTYAELIRLYAEEAGAPMRKVLAVPGVPDRLTQFAMGLLSPLPNALVASLVDSVSIDVIVDPQRAIDRYRFDRDPLTAREAIAAALEFDETAPIGSNWSDDLGLWSDEIALMAPEAAFAGDPDWAGPKIDQDVRSATTEASAEAVFAQLERLGGDAGWLVAQPLWEIRGLLDKVVNGPGLRRGRRHATALRIGDYVDWWRVTHLDRPHHLRFRAEMILPGVGWLEWHINEADGVTTVEQRAGFTARGLPGKAYWFAMLPFHAVLFPRLLARIIEAAEDRTAS